MWCSSRRTGYHCALVLSPKDQPNSPQDISDQPDSIRWHLSNQARGSGGLRQRGTVPWYLDSDHVSMFASISLISRFTLGKFKTIDHDATVQRINAVIARIRIDQSNPSLSCRTWLLQVIDAMIY